MKSSLEKIKLFTKKTAGKDTTCSYAQIRGIITYVNILVGPWHCDYKVHLPPSPNLEIRPFFFIPRVSFVWI